MILRRRWIDADGQPREELATFAPAEKGDERGSILEVPDAYEIIEGSPEELARPLLVVALSDPASSTGLFDGPLQDGARDASIEEHDAAKDAQAEARSAVGEQLAEQLASAAEPRRAALTKLAESAGLSDDELAALLGGDA